MRYSLPCAWPLDIIAACSEVKVGFSERAMNARMNPEEVAPLARAAGLGARVAEHPDRVSLFDAPATQNSSDILLVLGSADLLSALQAFSAYGNTSADLCVAPSASVFAAHVRDLNTVVFLSADDPPDITTVNDVADRLASLALLEPDDEAYAEREIIEGHNRADRLAARECALFRNAIAHHARIESKL